MSRITVRVQARKRVALIALDNCKSDLGDRLPHGPLRTVVDASVLRA